VEGNQKMSQHVYLDNSYTDEQIARMQESDSGSWVIDDLISSSDLTELRKLIDTVEYPEHGSTSKYAGSAYEHPPYGPIMQEIFHDKLVSEIGDHKLDFFAWQEAIKPWKIHADLRWYADKIPHKVILIPLDVVADRTGWADTYSITFKQRSYLRNNANSNTGQTGNTNQSSWKRPINQSNVEGCCDGYKIDEETWNTYMSHMPYDWAEGLEIETIYKWNPGSAVVWDQTQLHCADNFLARGIKTKLSILIMTNQA
jgi:hypothetical protein